MQCILEHDYCTYDKIIIEQNGICNTNNWNIYLSQWKQAYAMKLEMWVWAILTNS